MKTPKGSPENQDYLNKALDIAIRLSVIAVIVLGAFRIFSPFLVAVVWGSIIAITVYPIFLKLKRVLGNKSKLAGTVFILVSLAAVIVPTALLMESLIDGSVALIHNVQEGALVIPPPTENVKSWPVIGPATYDNWMAASLDMKATAAKLAPQLAGVSATLAAAFAGLGATVVQTLFALIIAGLLMMSSEGGYSGIYSIARRLAGDGGPAMVDLSKGTIRSVVKGVILVAAIQGLLSAGGLWVAGVPGVGLWALLVMVVAVIQLPPILILAPICFYVFQNSGTGMGIGFTIWSLLVSASDGFLKPIFLGRGVQVPMLVILIGAIGGMLRSGVIGLFIGPVILSIGYTLFTAWIAQTASSDNDAAKAASSGD